MHLIKESLKNVVQDLSGHIDYTCGLVQPLLEMHTYMELYSLHMDSLMLGARDRANAFE